MAAPAASVADNDRSTIAADVPGLITHSTHYIAEGPSLDLGCQARFWALAGDMAGDIAEITHWFVWAVSSKMASLTAIVAGLLIGAIGGNVAWPVTVVAEPGFKGG